MFAHFVPFDEFNNPLREVVDITEYIANHQFSPEDKSQMDNWDVIYECEDARDADRLAEQEKLMREARGFRAMLAGGDADDEDGVPDVSANAAGRTKAEELAHLKFFRKLQYAGYLGAISVGGQVDSRDKHPIVDGSWMTEALHEWEAEIKREQKKLASALDNVLHSEDQTRIDGRDDAVDGASAPRTEVGNETSIVFTTTDTGHGQNERTNVASEIPKYIPILKTKAISREQGMTEETPAQVISRLKVEHNLNEKQGIAFEIAAQSWIKVFVRRKTQKADVSEHASPEEPLRLLMTGPGGTGKSHSIKALKCFMMLYDSGHRLRLLAPTGSAASLIGGMTCHKGLALKIKQKSDRGKKVQRTTMDELYEVGDSVQKKAAIRRSWQNVDVVLIDEVSLLSLINLADIDHALRMAKEKPNEWFGGIIVIFSGDFCQYPPVAGNALYSCMRSNRELNDRELKRRLGRLAWKTLNAVVEFEEQFRMKDDPGYAMAAVRLRERRCTKADLALFNSRVIKSVKNHNGPDMREGDNGKAVMIVARNDVREEVNAYKAEAECGAGSSRRLLRCGALDYIDKKLVPNLGHAKCRDTVLELKTASLSAEGALPGFIPLFEGMPVILRGRNLAVELRIANGSQGYVYKVETAIDEYQIMYAKVALVHFPDSPIKLSGLPQGVYPIKPTTWTFSTVLEIEPGKPSRYKIRQFQLPIQPGFSVTGQSAQGKTMPKVFCDLAEGSYAAYVAVSRARRREDLFLYRPIKLDVLNRKRSIDLESELRRYKTMEHNTFIKFGFRSGTFVQVPDAEDRHFEPESRIFVGENALLWDEAASASSKAAMLPAAPLTEETATDVGKAQEQEGSQPRADAQTQAAVERTHIANTTDIEMYTALQDVPRSYTVAEVDVHDVNEIARCGDKRKRCGEEDLPVRKIRKLNSKALPGCTWSKTWSCAYDCVFMALYSIHRCSTEEWRLRWSVATPCAVALAQKFDKLAAVRNRHLEATSINKMRDEFKAYMAKVDHAAFPRDEPKAISIWELLTVVLHWTNQTLRLVARPGYHSAIKCHHHVNRSTMLQDLYDRKDSHLEAKDRHTHQCWVNSACTLDREHIWRPTHSKRCGNGSSTPFVLNDPPLILVLCHTPTMGNNVLPVRSLRVPGRRGQIRYSLSSIIYWGDNHFTSRIFVRGRTYMYDGQIASGNCRREDGSDIENLPQYELGRFTRLDNRMAFLFIYSQD